MNKNTENSNRHSKFYNTGYLSHKNITEVREKQGLLPQDLSNLCTEDPRVLYPAPATPLPTYCLPPISPDRLCTIYLRAP